MAQTAAFSDQPGNEYARAARAWRAGHERAILEEFQALLRLPNVARDLAGMERNAAHIRAGLERRGITSKLLAVDGAPPVILGELATPGATRTLVFYAHYDGQPVEPARWTGSGPFEPTLRDRGGRIVPLTGPFDPEWRIQARSASDDKAPIQAFLTALDGIRAAGLKLRSNVKFFFDGEEEAGSPHLGRILETFKDQLEADAWIFCDGPVHQSRKQQVVFGVRGSTGLNLTVFGPKRELHSGHYGNWAPNPVLGLARLMASMRDDDGRILIPGFYDDVEPLSEFEKKALAAAPDIEAGLREELGLARTEGGGRRLEELINLPALNFRGIAAAGVGAQSRNVIPAEATVSIDIRLVKGMDHRRAMQKLRDHVAAQGWQIVSGEPDDATRRKYPRLCRIEARESGYNAVRAPMDTPLAQQVIAAVRGARGDVVLMPTLGGSLPIAPIATVMGKPVIIVPIANHDNNQHGHNENIRLQNLWDGIETMAALLGL